MADIDDKHLRDSILGAIDQFLDLNGASIQSTQAASNTVHTLLSALNKTMLFPSPEPFCGRERMEQLRHAIDWIENFHLWHEWESESEITLCMSEMEEIFDTVAELADQVALHLTKTQVNKGKTFNHEKYHVSHFLSLSGNMRWTLHKSFQKYKDQKYKDQKYKDQKYKDHKCEQESGLAIFDTTMLSISEAQVWRVSDLLLFLDKKLGSKDSAIGYWARRWAATADEYLCWEFAPKSALVKFVTCQAMNSWKEGREHKFLRPAFGESQTLAIFNGKTPIPLGIDEYIRRLSFFLFEIMDRLSPNTIGANLINHLIANFDDPYSWGYALDRNKPEFKEKLSALVNIEYTSSIVSWESDEHIRGE
ncbi:uncharacterized protein N7529_001559 [Penicillium soppii]|uniref:uncharacterized protein n=1 Tax=Penicillium soppii TaxID=69789 RepID=UPI002547B8C6|nr:uncharacterized protein N7529_001559 [Penicillium soppii]KAJ5875975.1 hypothetical protein N7529_001559 [Penicillium soppii]